MAHSTGSHTKFHHRYHIVWFRKYRYKVLHSEVLIGVREIIRQVCAEPGVTIVNGALSRDHGHLFVEIPPNVLVSDFVRRSKGRSSRTIHQESNTCANATEANGPGNEDTSRPHSATSAMKSSCGF
ncbi:MAG: hypothetical protein NVS3B5_12980 [Sphingomicrobium sp.]